MDIGQVYFISSLVVLIMSFSVFLKGVTMIRKVEDKQWEEQQSQVAETIERT